MKKNAITNILWNIDLFMSGICIMVLVIITVAGVFARYVMNAPFVWLEEIQFILTVQAAFWGASVAFKKAGHVSIEVIVDSFPKKLRFIVELIIMVVVFACLIFLVKQQITRSISLFMSQRKTNILNFPAYLNYIVVSIACIFMIIHHAIYNFKKYFWKQTEKEGN